MSSISVERFWDTDSLETLGFFAEGHHPVNDFFAALQKEVGQDYNLENLEIQYQHWVTDPADDDDSPTQWTVREVKADDLHGRQITAVYLS